MKCYFFFLFLGIATYFPSSAQEVEVPSVYSNLYKNEEGQFYFEVDGKRYDEVITPPNYTLDQLTGDPKGTQKGIVLNFGEALEGAKVYFGFIPYGDSKHPQPVYFKRTVIVENGVAEIDILQLAGKYDMVGWEKKRKGTIGYRVQSKKGTLLYDGKVSFKVESSSFIVDCTIMEGPFVNNVTPKSAIISFTTNQKIIASVKVGDKTFSGKKPTRNHEVEINGLSPNTQYEYVVEYSGNEQNYSFKTAPKLGSRMPFTFAYASDSRNGQGGGERNLYGTNFYIMKKIMALANFKQASFFQFSGDLINGYLPDIGEINLQYANWKRAVEPFGHYFPIYKSMGNHESLMRVFKDKENHGIYIDRFPFNTESTEAIFAKNFVLPENGPLSEDDSKYDPSKKEIDFPSYKENVYYYCYDNVAIVVLNSNYLYAPSTDQIPFSSGGLHAYIMDQQLEWLKLTLKTLEKDNNIDHIFITQHTPIFPNGGHVGDDMWYNGNNDFRPYVNGQMLEKGIIERRDQLLDLIVNKSNKVVAILTGDEHNYARTEIGTKTNIYPESYSYKKIKLKRTVHQINNGAAGAPYYAQEETPWTPMVSGFTTQNALVFFHIEGNKVEMEVLNPDTLEEVDRLVLR